MPCSKEASDSSKDKSPLSIFLTSCSKVSSECSKDVFLLLVIIPMFYKRIGAIYTPKLLGCIIILPDRCFVVCFCRFALLNIFIVLLGVFELLFRLLNTLVIQIGRASCREE